MTALDGLRALSVGAVFVYHARPQTFPGGLIGVSVFFALSGFLITNLLVAEHKRFARISLRSFYVRRAARLAPALLVAIALALLVVAVGASTWREYALETVAALGYVSNFYVAATLTEGPLSHTWSLAVEEQFYLLWPVVVVLLLRRRNGEPWLMRSALTVAALLAATKPLGFSLLGVGVYYTPWAHLDAMLFGSAAAVAPPSFRAALLRVRITVPACLLMLGVAVFVFDRYTDPALSWGGLTVTALVAVALVVAVSGDHDESGLTVRVLGSRVLVWFGQRSYGLYLFHIPLLVAGFVVVQPPWLAVLCTAVATTVLAAASYRWVETPMLRWSRNRGAGSAHGDAVLGAKVGGDGGTVARRQD